MLATLIIGLREGLEAALIVGIIAAFLRKNGKSLAAMWVGVALAVVLSIAVGVALDRIERALPQADQEGMESVIGCVAVFFVTGMILWMNRHARDMKRQLESEAAEALGRAGSYALASMAFLAVLKEGFETSVFLLATFSAAQSAAWAATGALTGLLMAVLVGWGIYVGGVRINLSRFFRVTGVFLVLVAAGLVVTSLRSAHEAGWLDAGQQTVLNLSWLVAPGTVRSALITGVLGIPADPRMIEAAGWLAYLVPVSLLVFWPASRRPRAETVVWLRFAAAAGVAFAAAAVTIFYPVPRLPLPRQIPLVAANGGPSLIGRAELDTGSVQAAPVLFIRFDKTPALRLSLVAGKQTSVVHEGLWTLAWHVRTDGTPSSTPSRLTLDEVVALNHGRIPIGLNPGQHPGPFLASWSSRRTIDVWIADGHLLDAAARHDTLVSLSGSGLQMPRTLAVDDSHPSAVPDWRVAPDYVARASKALRTLAAARVEHAFWAVKLPVALLLVACLLVAWACRGRRRFVRIRRDAGDHSSSSGLTAGGRNNNTEGHLHASH